MNFDIFCKKQKKKLCRGITFAYDVEKMRLICQKNREKKGPRFHPGLPGELFSDSENSKKVKSYLEKKFFFYKIKKIQKFKKIQKNKKV